jgi:hypothetical protein
MTRPALGADAFSGFFTEADVLNAFDSLFGISGTFFCCHLFSPEKSLGKRAETPQVSLDFEN